LIVHHPSLPPRRVTDVVGVIDLMPTLLDLTGAKDLPAFDGRSIVPLLRGGTLEPRAAIGEQLWGPRETALRDGVHTWITTRAGTALYDVGTDPWEHDDRAADEPTLAADGKARIEAFRAACQAEGTRLNAPVAVDPDRARALKSLGYVE
jgi:arylsulfatase A-like enzyme